MELMLDGELRWSGSELRRDQQQVGAERRIIFPLRGLSALSRSLPHCARVLLSPHLTRRCVTLAYSLLDD